MEYTNLNTYIYHLSYLGIFLWFAIIEQFTPIPEEISLISTGYIAIHSGLNPILCGIAAFTGLILLDNTLFFISAKGRKLSQKLLKKVNAEWLTKAQEKLKHNAARTLFISALIPNLRFFSPILAGISGISWKLFLLINGLATLSYTIVYLVMGMVLQKPLSMIMKKVDVAHHIIFILVMLAITVYFTWKAKNTIFKKA